MLFSDSPPLPPRRSRPPPAVYVNTDTPAQQQPLLRKHQVSHPLLNLTTNSDSVAGSADSQQNQLLPRDHQVSEPPLTIPIKGDVSANIGSQESTGSQSGDIVYRPLVMCPSDSEPQSSGSGPNIEPYIRAGARPRLTVQLPDWTPDTGQETSGSQTDSNQTSDEYQYVPTSDQIYVPAQKTVSNT